MSDKRTKTTDPTASFMRSLCAGEILEQVVFPFPVADPEEAELVKSVADAVDDLMEGREEDFRDWDAAAHLPEEFIEELKEFGMFGLIIPEEHGGMGFGNFAYSRTLQQLARHDASVAVTVGAHSSIGMRGLKLFGTEEQKRRWYGPLASGELIAAFCLTEPGAGSDAASIRTTALEQDDHYVLNGSKNFVTNGGIARVFTITASTPDLGNAGRGQSLVLLERGDDGQVEGDFGRPPARVAGQVHIGWTVECTGQEARLLDLRAQAGCSAEVPPNVAQCVMPPRDVAARRAVERVQAEVGDVPGQGAH